MDMMGILPTGYGKTLIYTILPVVLDMLPGKHIGWHVQPHVDMMTGVGHWKKDYT